ncbi:unnamed protein product, partial [Adineta steineri]
MDNSSLGLVMHDRNYGRHKCLHWRWIIVLCICLFNAIISVIILYLLLKCGLCIPRESNINAATTLTTTTIVPTIEIIPTTTIVPVADIIRTTAEEIPDAIVLVEIEIVPEIKEIIPTTTRVPGIEEVFSTTMVPEIEIVHTTTIVPEIEEVYTTTIVPEIEEVFTTTIVPPIVIEPTTDIVLTTTVPIQQSKWFNSGSMIYARNGHTASVLKDGKVLITAGLYNDYPLNSSELYDPSTESWKL